jgi:peroxiredoxin
MVVCRARLVLVALVLVGAVISPAVRTAVLLASEAAGAVTLHEDFPQATLPDAVTGKPLALAEGRGEKATVLLCLATDCPISDEYLSTIKRIADAYGERGVAFLGIDPNGGDTLELMREYAQQNELSFPLLKDEGGKVSRRLLFSVTPEARVFDASGKLVYSGRIDDRYRRGGATDAQVARDLENALDEVLAGKPVSAARTKAMGCPIQITPPKAQ